MEKPPPEGPAAPRAVPPPHLILHGWLDAETLRGLMDFTLAHESAFKPARLVGGKVDAAVRVSHVIRELGPYRDLLRGKIAEQLPALTAALAIGTIAEPDIELELAAHGDGAFFKRHIDLGTMDRGITKFMRVLSCVYYFCFEPQAFRGGALRLYAVGGDGRQHVDVEPTHNTLVVFPSWVAHEVLPVRCPSGRFEDYRFAVNCWARRLTNSAPA